MLLDSINYFNTCVRNQSVTDSGTFCAVQYIVCRVDGGLWGPHIVQSVPVNSSVD